MADERRSDSYEQRSRSPSPDDKKARSPARSARSSSRSPRGHSRMPFDLGLITHFLADKRSPPPKTHKDRDYCYNCGKPGHYVKDCPLPKDFEKKECFYCKKVGHTSKFCPLIQARDSRQRGPYRRDPRERGLFLIFD